MNGVRLLAQMVQDWNMDLKDHRSNPTGDTIAVATALLLFPLLMLTDKCSQPGDSSGTPLK